jgi:hypothetical protein
MAKIDSVKDGSYPQNCIDLGRRVSREELERRIPGHELRYLSTLPPEFNPDQPSPSAQHVVVELEMDKPPGQLLTDTGCYLLPQRSPHEAEALLFPQTSQQARRDGFTRTRCHASRGAHPAYRVANAEGVGQGVRRRAGLHTRQATPHQHAGPSDGPHVILKWLPQALQDVIAVLRSCIPHAHAVVGPRPFPRQRHLPPTAQPDIRNRAGRGPKRACGYQGGFRKWQPDRRSDMMAIQENC